MNNVKTKSKLNESHLSLTTFGKFKLKPEVTLVIYTTGKLENFSFPFYIIDVKCKPILGLKAWSEFKLIRRTGAITCTERSEK